MKLTMRVKMSSHEKVIDYETMENIIEMLRNRGFNDIAILGIPFSNNDPKTKGRRKKKVTQKTPKRQKEEKEEESTSTFMTLDQFDDQDSYTDNIEPLFLNGYVMVVDYDEEQDDSEKYKEVYLIHPGGNQTSREDVVEAKTSLFYAEKSNYMKSNQININGCIVVGDAIMNTKTLVKLVHPRIFIQYFEVDEIRKPECLFGSIYFKLTQQEIDDLYGELKIKNGRNLPKLITGDPVVKYYGWRVGDVIKMYRKAVGLPTIVDASISYALVINGAYNEIKNYNDLSVLKNKQLKEMLKDLGVNSKGDRGELIDKYNEFKGK